MLGPVVLVAVAILILRVGGGLRGFRPTQCNLIYKNACHQYRETGNHEIMCRESAQHKLCQQTCNSGSCRLHCHASNSCTQRCVAGRCNNIFCKSKYCRQDCTRGSCQLMDCGGETCRQKCLMGGCNMLCSKGATICTQWCELGKCTMRCPPGVKSCEQTCNGGKCNMICNAEKCKRSCKGGECTYGAEVTRGLEAVLGAPRYIYCNDDLRESICMQTCSEGNCDMKYKYSHHSSLLQVCAGGSCHFDCKAPRKCTQVCIGGKCMKYLCNSRVCIQECVAGGCTMECEAETCLQTCRGGDCRMSCMSNVKQCFQWCPGGNCILGCEAEQCKRYCQSGSCVTPAQAPKLQAVARRVRCAMLTRECHQQCPQKRSCSFLGWLHYGIFRSINQTCNEGDCRRMECRASIKCTQTCNDGACYSMSCTSTNCLQDCAGANCNMECNSEHCTQICRGGGCQMKCAETVKTCKQSCNPQNLNCQSICLAKTCSVTLI